MIIPIEKILNNINLIEQDLQELNKKSIALDVHITPTGLIKLDLGIIHKITKLNIRCENPCNNS